MDPLDQDTTPENQARYFQLLRRLTPAERLRIVNATSHRMREMAEAGIRRRLPNADEGQIRDELRRVRYGDGSAAQEQSRPFR
jgi:hypothetical protein